MSGHTPGPWVVQNGCNVFAPHLHEPLSRVDYIAVTGGLSGKDTIERDAANAHLIAAAPELLEALEEIAHLRPGGDVATCVAPRKLIERIEKIALAAIAKATTS